jgi:hypothetical protein
VPTAVPRHDRFATDPAGAHRADCAGRWRRHGVELGDRRIALDGWDLLLVDSAESGVAPATEAWLAGQRHRRSLVVTHVPLDLPAVRAYIRGRDADRDLAVYTQARSPRLFADRFAGRVRAVFSGHLHFAGHLRQDGIDLHLVDAVFARGVEPPTVLLIEGVGDDLRVASVAVGSVDPR